MDTTEGGQVTSVRIPESPEPVREWLLTYGPDDIVGYRASSSYCVFANYLVSKGAEGVCVVGHEYSTDYDLDTWYPTPTWAYNTLLELDWNEESDGPIARDLALAHFPKGAEIASHDSQEGANELHEKGAEAK